MNTKKLLSEAQRMKALATTLLDCATHIEESLLAGEGKKPAGTRKGNVAKLSAQILANRNRTIAKRISQ